MMHAGGMHASVVDCTRVINALGEKGEVARAVDMFQKLSSPAPDHLAYVTSCSTAWRGRQGDLACHLMRSMHDNGIIGRR